MIAALCLGVAIAAPPVAAAPSGDRGTYVKMNAAFGCRDDKTTTRLQNTIEAKDAEGFKALATPLMLSGQCIFWKQDQRVRIEERGGVFGRDCLVAYGTAGPCYWTRRDAVEERHVK